MGFRAPVQQNHIEIFKKYSEVQSSLAPCMPTAGAAAMPTQDLKEVEEWPGDTCGHKTSDDVVATTDAFAFPGFLCTCSSNCTLPMCISIPLSPFLLLGHASRYLPYQPFWPFFTLEFRSHCTESPACISLIRQAAFYSGVTPMDTFVCLHLPPSS